jgi:hypothetical protein
MLFFFLFFHLGVTPFRRDDDYTTRGDHELCDVPGERYSLPATAYRSVKVGNASDRIPEGRLSDCLVHLLLTIMSTISVDSRLMLRSN